MNFGERKGIRKKKKTEKENKKTKEMKQKCKIFEQLRTDFVFCFCKIFKVTSFK